MKNARLIWMNIHPGKRELASLRCACHSDDLARRHPLEEQLSHALPPQVLASSGVNRRDFIKMMTASFGLAGLGLASCAAPPPEIPFQAKSTTPLEPVYCFDSVGHKSGSTPFVLGGTCCCTPTLQIVSKYHADGLLPDLQLKNLLAIYDEKGIKTALDHTGCNNQCAWGPHIVKGGHCMVPPTPATYNFEEVRYGFKLVPVPKKQT